MSDAPPAGRGRKTTLAVATATVVAVTVSAVVLTPVIREAWYVHQLRTGESDVRAHAAARLADLSSTRAVPALVEILGAGEELSEELHLAVVRALGVLAPRATDVAVPVLIETLTASEEIAEEAARALSELGEQPLPSVLDALRRMDELALQVEVPPTPTIPTTPPEPPMWILSRRLQRVLVGMGAAAFDRLLGELDDSDETYRRRVIRVLLAIEWRSIRLSKAKVWLTDFDLGRRAWALYFLEHAGSEAKAFLGDAVARGLDSSEDPEIRRRAVRAALSIGRSATTLTTLLPCLADSDPELRWALISTIYLRPEGPAADVVAASLVLRLSDPENRIASRAADLLGAAGMAGIPLLFKELAGADDERTRKGADALGRS